jgi:DNA-binding beta-propeller fold protein YncE
MGARAGLAVRAVAAGVLVSVGIAGCSAATSGQAAGPSASTPNAGGRASGTSPGPPVTVYVIADNAVVAIRAATGARSREIPAGAVPYAVAVTPDGKTAYVLSGETGAVIPISLATGKPGAAISPGGAGTFPTAIAITPDGRTAYVPVTVGGYEMVIPIDTAANTAGQPIRIGASDAGGVPITLSDCDRSAARLFAGGAVD